MNRHGVWLVSAAMLMVATGSVLAQDAKEPDQQPLRGPTVRDDTVPGESRRFTGGSQRRKEAVGASIPNRIFAKAVDTLRGEQADPTIRLAQDQADEIARIERDLRQKQLAFLADHRDEIAELRKSASPEVRRRLDQLLPGSAGIRARRNADGGGSEESPAKETPKSAKPSPDDGQMQMDGADGAMKEGQASADDRRDRIAKLLESAPKLEEVHGSVWAILTPAQREHVEKQIERLKSETQTKRADTKEARKDKSSEDSKPAAKGGAPDLSKLPPRIRERWESMTPQEREEAIRRLKNRG